MRLPDHYADPLRDALHAHAKHATDAFEANDLEATKAALAACWISRMKAMEIILDAEAEVRAQTHRSAA